MIQKYKYINVQRGSEEGTQSTNNKGMTSRLPALAFFNF